ncbi:MAG: hypothetical protein AB7L94_42415 [Kofleriaceae bacterium]
MRAQVAAATHAAAQVRAAVADSALAVSEAVRAAAVLAAWRLAAAADSARTTIEVVRAFDRIKYAETRTEPAMVANAITAAVAVAVASHPAVHDERVAPTWAFDRTPPRRQRGVWSARIGARSGGASAR